MELTIKKKRSYPTPAQKSRLIALIEADEELRQGKFSAKFSKKEAEKRWRSIAEDVNSIPGSMKEWTEWRKTWQDMKGAAKKKHSMVRQSVQSTGGGPPAPPLSQDELSIINTMAVSTLVGHTDSIESVVDFKDLPITPTTCCTLPPATVGNSNIIWDGHKELLTTSSSAVAVASSHVTPNSSCSWNEYRDIPATSINVAESATTTTMHRNKENNIKKKYKPTASKRLERSLAIATNMKDHLDEELKLKKEFYKDVLTEMRRQTAVLSVIADRFSGQHNN